MSFYEQLNNESEPMILCTDMSELNSQTDEGYSIVPTIHPTWKTASKRLLVVIETIDSLDLRNQQLLSGSTDDSGGFKRAKSSATEHNPMRSILSNILDLSIDLLRPYGIEVDVADYALGVVNFNARKIRNLEVKDQVRSFPAFADRVIETIRKLKPTHLLVLGDTASHYLLRKLEAPEGTPDHLCPGAVELNSQVKRGWLFKRKLGKREFFMLSSLDLEGLYRPQTGLFDEDESDDSDSDRYAAADLLYFVTRNISSLFAEKMLHDLSHIVPKPVYVDTIEKFDRFYSKLTEAEMLATDLETKSLFNTRNAIYLAQFAFTVDKAYCIPVSHPKSPFSEEDQEYILGKFRRYFLSKEAKTIAFLNGTFDTRIMRAQTELPIIPHHRIHEVTAGEQLLDENLGLFGRFKMYFNGGYIKTSYQNLRNMLCMYGNDWYYRAAFSKEERHLVGSFPPDDPNVLLYGAADAQFTLAIALEQYERAHNVLVLPKLDGKWKRYGKFFKAHLLNQMSNTVQSISHAEQSGSPVDVEYLNKLMGPTSPLKTLIKESLAEMHTMPSVQKASKVLLQSAGKATSSIWGNDVSMTVFDPNKPDHKSRLFFDVMRLPSVSTTDTGKPAVDKVFVAAYREKYREVALLEQISKAGKLMSTYVKGWLKQIEQSVDGIKDHCLRPSFGFFTIVTGRLNSFNPSLQQVPSRGPLADYVKRAFVAPVGCLLWRFDYSAHEVRGWSWLSGDKNIAAAFQIGLDLRRALIQVATLLVPKGMKSAADVDSAIEAGTLSPKKAKRIKEILEVRSKLKRDGDVHVQSVFRFLKKRVDKDHPLRDAIKRIVFGLIYGKSLRTLSRDISVPNLDVQLRKEIAGLETKLTEITEKEARKLIRGDLHDLNSRLERFESAESPDAFWLDEATDITEKMFAEFSEGAAWLENARTQIREHAHLVSPIGRVRRLWRVYTGKKGIIAAAERRAQNSPIQGFASEVGCSSAFLILKHCYMYIRKHKLDMKLMPRYCRAVHDANYFVVPHEMTIPFVHICQYMATNGVVAWYKELFGMDFTIEPEIEMETGASEGKEHALKWNWELPELPMLIRKALTDQVALGRLKGSKLDSTYEAVMEPWSDEDRRRDLQENYPLLNVRDLHSQIGAALNSAVFKEAA